MTPIAGSFLRRSFSRGRASGGGSVMPKSAVIGGAGLLQGHNSGQAVSFLHSLVAESLAMLPHESDPKTAAAAASPGSSPPGSRSNSAGGSHVAAAAMAAGAAAAAAVSSSRVGRRYGRSISMPDEEEEEEAALAAMLMMLPCIEVSAVQAAPQQFSLPLVAAALGEDMQKLILQQQQQQLGTRGLSAAAQHPDNAPFAAAAASGSSSHTSSNMSNTVGDKDGLINHQPVQPASQGVELKLRTLSAAPALAQQYTKAQVLLAQTFGANVQQPPAAAAATVAAEAARAAAAAGVAAAGASTARGKGTPGRKSAAPAAAAAAASPAAAAAKDEESPNPRGGKVKASQGQSRSSNAPLSPTAATAAPQPAAAAAREGMHATDALSALLSGRQSPVRFRILTASVEQQHKRQQQRQRMLSASLDGGSSNSISRAFPDLICNSSSDPGSAAAAAGKLGSSRLSGLGLSSLRPFSVTPEPWLHPAAAAAVDTSSAAAYAYRTRSLSPGPGSSNSSLANAAAANSIWAPGASGSVDAGHVGSSSSSVGVPNDFADLTTKGSSYADQQIAITRVVASRHSAPTTHLIRRQASSGGGEWSSDRQSFWGQNSNKHNRPRESTIQGGAGDFPIHVEGISSRTDDSSEGQQGRKFEFEKHLKRLQDQWKQPSPDEIDAEVAMSAPTASDVGADFAFGDVGRLIKRYQQQPDLYPAAFNLNNALSSRQQVSALAHALPQMPNLTMLHLRNNDLDDWALQILVSAILQASCCSIRSLDLGYNRLTAEAARILLPLLHQPARKAAAAAAAAAGASDVSLGYTRSASSAAGGWSKSGACETAMLTQLVLAGNAIGDAGAEVVCRVVALGDCMLQLLDVSSCGLTDRCAGCLKALLEGARQLQVLRIGWNNLGPKGGKALADGLRYCSTLQQLLLPWSGISDSGASHIAKALENNSSVKLLDLSGCQVSAATCVVLVETLSVNKELELLVLQDNPLGAVGAHRLLKAVHAGHVKHVDIAGCGFLNASRITAHNSAPAALKASPTNSSAAAAATSEADSKKRPASQAAVAKEIGGASGAAAAFSAREPDGKYTLDLSTPSDRQVAVELLKLAADHGIDSWVNPTLNKKAYNISAVTKQQLPSSGTLTVTFVAKHKPNWEATPLSDAEFDGMWTTLVDPQRLAATAAELDRQLNAQNLGFYTRDSSSGGLGQQNLEDSVFVTQSSGVGLPQEGLHNIRGPYGRDSVRGSGAGLQHGYRPSRQSIVPGAAGGQQHLHAVKDEWKMDLLQVLNQDCYFTSDQARQIVSAFTYGEDKVDAAVKVFGHVVDPENFSSQVYTELNSWQVESVDARIGCLKLFSPANPTGKYSLLLSHPAEHLVAVRLVELFCQQHIDGYCAFPHSVCFTSAVLNNQEMPAQTLAEPASIKLPKSGIFKVSFVDLKPIPGEAKPLSPEAFAVLVGVLVASRHLDAKALAAAIDDIDVATKVQIVDRFDTWGATHGPFTGKVAALRRLSQSSGPVIVKDMERFVETMHIFAIHHYLTGGQLIELVKLLPESATEEQVELCSCFWARLTDRSKAWSNVMRVLGKEQQVALAQRLGYANVFDAVRPAMHYRLRMWRADEHQVAWRLHRMALTSRHSCFASFCIDGIAKKIKEDSNLWSLMRGNAGDKDTPTVILDFDFDWEDAQLPHWAAVTIQAAWRAYKIRKATLPPIRLTYKPPSRQSTATGVRASSRLGARPSVAAAGHVALVLSGAMSSSMASSVLQRTVTASSLSSTSGFARSPLASPTKQPGGTKPEWDMLRAGKGSGGEGSAREEREAALSRLGRMQQL